LACDKDIYQEPRHGPPLPKGEHYLTIGWKQVGVVSSNDPLADSTNCVTMQILEAFRHYKRLPYTFIYLFAFFLLADVRRFSVCENLTFADKALAGAQYDRDARFNMSERQIPVLVPREYISWACAGDYFGNEACNHFISLHLCGF
jgi:hypothetical protein